MSAVRSESEMTNILFAQAREMDASGDPVGAMKFYDAALALNADNYVAYKLRGNCLYKLGKPSEAMDDYNRALQIQPKDAEVLYNRAVMKKAMGNLDDALVDICNALLLNNKLFRAYMLRGDILIEFGRLEEAQFDFARAIEIDPTSVSAQYGYGKAALLQQSGSDDRQALFEYIYKERAWGRSSDPSDMYYSGSGTRMAAHSSAYLEAVGSFLQEQQPMLNAVDIGCGDFVIGSKVRAFCSKYIACDVVAGLIDHNKTTYAHLDVDFRALDAVNDPLPDGDIVFIREVLQHLSNSDIQEIISKVRQNYKYAIISECLPIGTFTPNLDKVTSDKIRPNVNGSGVILTEPPFNLFCQQERVLCVSPHGRTSIVTTLYSF